MKKIIITSIVCVFTSLTLFGQASKKTYKRFTDSNFEVGDVILSPTIVFHLNHCSVVTESVDSVKVIADFLKQHTTYKVELGVHTDIRGSNEANLTLSLCRAKELVGLLNQVFKISIDNLTPKGYGETEPLINQMEINQAIDKSKAEELHKRNGRVEIKILGMS